MAKRQSYLDFDYDEGTGGSDSVLINLGELNYYSLKQLKFFSQQLRILNWRKLNSREELIQAIVEKEANADNQPVLDEEELISPKLVYISKVIDDDKWLLRYFNGKLEYLLGLNPNGIPFTIEYHYPGLQITWAFNQDGDLTAHKVFIEDLLIVDFWDTEKQQPVRSYSLLVDDQYRGIPTEAILKRLKQIKEKVQESTDLPPPLAGLVNEYLYG